MNKRFKWFMALAGSALLIAAMAIPAFAAGPSGQNNQTQASGQYGMGNCQGIGLRLGTGPGDAVTELLGLTAEEIKTERQAGKSLVQIAEAKGITEEALVNAILTEKKTALDALVTAGTITQEIADQRLAEMTERVQESVNRTATGPQSWSGANGNGQKGTGMMNKGNAQGGNQANCTGTPGTCTGTGTGTGTGQMMRGGRTAK